MTKKTITDAVSRSALIRPGMRVLCAVSGGADSMCLLHVLFSNRESLGITVAAAHFNHCLRGGESERDCAFVTSFCEEHRIPLLSERGDAAAFARSSGMGIEESARTLRYEFLSRAAEKLGCTVVATAHNLEDNAETVLFHLVRGSASEGLAGIPPVRGNVIRPLLGVSRKEIEAYLEEHHIPFVTDSSNLSDDYTRNKLRHQVLPVLASVNPAFSEAVFRSGELLRQDTACLDALAEDFIRTYYDGSSLPADRLLSLHRAVSSRAVRRLCPHPLSKTHVDAVLSAAKETERTFVDVPGLRICVEQGRVYFAVSEVRTIPDTVLTEGHTAAIPEAGLLVSTEISVYSEKINGLFKPFCFKCDEIYGRLLLTSRREGDSIRLLGRGCTKPVRKLYAEAGMTQAQRALTPVLRDDAGVLAVYGFGVSERAVPRQGDRVYQITVHRQSDIPEAGPADQEREEFLEEN